MVLGVMLNYVSAIIKFRHKKTALLAVFYLISRMMVGAVGFEPTTPWSQTRCATKLRHTPILIRDWGG